MKKLVAVLALVLACGSDPPPQDDWTTMAQATRTCGPTPPERFATYPAGAYLGFVCDYPCAELQGERAAWTVDFMYLPDGVQLRTTRTGPCP